MSPIEETITTSRSWGIRCGGTWANGGMFSAVPPGRPLNTCAMAIYPPCPSCPAVTMVRPIWSGCSLEEFMTCPYNLANNRQNRMMADLSWWAANLSIMSESPRWAMLLESAKRNLRNMAFYGLTEYQRLRRTVPLRANIRLSLHRTIHAAQWQACCERRGGTESSRQDSKSLTSGTWSCTNTHGTFSSSASSMPDSRERRGGPAATPAGEAQVTCQGDAVVGGDWKSCF